MTFSLGQLFRRFKSKVCPYFKCKETPREAEARVRREAKRAKKQGNDAPTKSQQKRRRRIVHKNFNMNTSKAHMHDHYGDIIDRFGMTDSYTSRIVCFPLCRSVLNANFISP